MGEQAFSQSISTPFFAFLSEKRTGSPGRAYLIALSSRIEASCRTAYSSPVKESPGSIKRERGVPWASAASEKESAVSVSASLTGKDEKRSAGSSSSKRESVTSDWTSPVSFSV